MIRADRPETYTPRTPSGRSPGLSASVFSLSLAGGRAPPSKSWSRPRGLPRSRPIWPCAPRRARKAIRDMRLQRLLGHLSALVHPSPRSVLVVGLGAGVTAGSFVVHPEVGRIVICEIEPRVVGAAARFFADANHGVLSDPRVEVIYDDAR